MKGKYILGLIGLGILLYLGSVVGPGASGSGALSVANKKISLKKVEMKMDQYAAKDMGDGEFEVPIVFKGYFTNSSKKRFEFITLNWFYRYRQEEERGKFTIEDIAPGERVSLAGDQLSMIRLPGFAGGVFQFEVSFEDAAFVE
ncbi:hypothetical protein OAO01_08895 [Oligoflexia bacterium]|nr:hypothetical protein [Oligoflexia bacterium]